MEPSDYSTNYNMLARHTQHYTLFPFFHQDLLQRAGIILLHFAFTIIE